ncbi:hypothetical protein A9Q79_02295 [Methylophaga sp. 42_25_T18]|nr:hypothetical protein A9Q79_02295 [Methylophaga sp. 42_25_T18]OUR87173.1 hypothetical protein A9Q92_04740 [Methylophaga sp. 42_8_T64]
MKSLLLSLSVLSLFVFNSAFANQADRSDKGAPSFDHAEISDFQIAGGKDKPKKNKDKAKKAMKEKVELDDDVDEMKKDKSKKAKKEKDELDDDVDTDEDSDKLKGIEKQTAKKADQEQKELDKGSEQGQASREEHRKKWWQFWGDESEE